MHVVLLVIKHQVRVTLAKRSFWVMTFLFPLAILAANVISQVATQGLIAGDEDVLSAPQTAGALTIGYVDEADIVQEVPSDIPAGWLRALESEEAAAAALAAEEIDEYVIVSPGYVETGELVVVQAEFGLFGREAGEHVMRYTLTANLLGSEEMARVVRANTGDARMIRNLTRLGALAEEGAQREEAPDGASGGLGLMFPYVVMFALFFILISSSSLVLQSVSAEKESRVVEVLLVSVRARELMMGKVLGLGAISLLQMLTWLAIGGLALGGGRALLGAALNITVPPGFAVYVVVYLLLGYLTYASALAAIGAMAPSLREGNQFQIMVLAPLMLPLMLNVSLQQQPNGPLAIALSLFPPSAPVAMLMRLTMTAVPFWQVALSTGGLAVTALLIVSLAGRFFRADTLLSGASLNVQRFVQEFRRGRAS